MIPAVPRACTCRRQLAGCLFTPPQTCTPTRSRSSCSVPGPKRWSPSSGLTSSERAVVALVMQGLSSREISDHLMITTVPVHDHLKEVYRKTGTNGRGLALDTWAQANSGL